MRRVALALLLLLAPIPSAAQTPDTALAPRVRTLEELVRLLRQQLAEQAGAGVVPREGYRVELGGALLLNGYHNTANVNLQDVPQTATPVATGLPDGGTGATVRQTRLAVFALAPRTLGAALTGELDLDFFGASTPFVPGRTFPMPRLRRMRADLVWSHVAVMAGQEAPLVAELNPVSLAAVGLPEFAGSGNLWLWIPQVRAGVSAGGRVRAGLDVAVLAPNAAMPEEQPGLNDRAERTARPFLQGRAFARWGDPENASELGIGGHIGWIAQGTDSLLTSRAAVGSFLVNLTPVADLRGEVFVGEALGLLGGGGVGQTLGPGGPVDTKGGWVQVNVRPHRVLELGVAAGLDDPDDADLDPANGTLENRTFSGYVTVRPRPFVVGVAVRRTGTSFIQPAVRAWNTHLNVVMGLLF